MIAGRSWQLGEAGDREFTGRAAAGYDALAKRYVGVWIESTVPHMLATEGEYGPATKIETATGRGTGPASGKPCEDKSTTPRNRKDVRIFILNIRTAHSGDAFFKLLEITSIPRAKQGRRAAAAARRAVEAGGGTGRRPAGRPPDD